MPQVTEFIWVPLKSHGHRDQAKAEFANVLDDHVTQPGLIASYKGYVLSGPSAVEFANVWESEEAYNASHENPAGEAFVKVADEAPHNANHRAVALDGSLTSLATARVVQVVTVVPTQANTASISSVASSIPGAESIVQGWSIDNNQHPSGPTKPKTFVLVAAYGGLDEYYKAAPSVESLLSGLGTYESHVTIFEKI